ncbi:MAG: cell wall hydrolase [Blastomonas sp.]
MSKILQAASTAAIVASTLASIAMIDETPAFAASNLVSLALNPVSEPASADGAEAGAQVEITTAGDEGALGPVADDTDESADAQPTPEMEPPASLGELVAQQDIPAELSAEQNCLAGTVYFESKGESLIGQLAVAKVVLARRDSRRFPGTICGVVYQRSQFSFVRGGRMPAINKSSNSWKRAVAISQIALEDSWESPVEGALFFHARHVSPGWRLTRLASVDNHVFYR